MSSRGIPFAVTTVILASLMIGAVPGPAMEFSDVPANAWFASYVRDAVSLGIVSGYKDAYGNLTGKFGPEKSVTVGEALKIVLESAGYDASTGVGYGHWAAKYLSIAIGHRFDLTQQTSIYLDGGATRSEVASLVADAFKIPYPDAMLVRENFTDVDVYNPYHYTNAINRLLQTGIITGDGRSCFVQPGTPCARTTFRPADSMNRAEIVKVVLLARKLYGEPGNVSSMSSQSSRSFSSQSSRSMSIGSCTYYDCGPAPMMPNWQCPDGSMAGPSCERLPDTRCGWLIRQCGMSSSTAFASSRSSSSRSSSRSSSASSSRSSSSARSAQTQTVIYTSTGFQPSYLSIRQGDSITFKNQSGLAMWVASNPHPVHTDYPEFDEHQSTASGGTFTFTLGRMGVWGYHNHINPSHQAVVSVEQ